MTKKDIKRMKDHPMIVNMYGTLFPKFSSYQKEKEIFVKFDRQKKLFQFEFYKKKLIEEEKCQLTGEKFKNEYKKSESKLFYDFTEKTLIPIMEEVYEKYKKKD